MVEYEADNNRFKSIKTTSGEIVPAQIQRSTTALKE